ncbi:MAG: hypothetical protein KDC80_08235 [Saprospiraceae bacterium]|nr:hypothetical protein [Saprospiraceae bacterium]
MLRRVTLFFSGILWLTSSQVWAQWNAIAGYELSTADAGPVNQMLQAFNNQHVHTLGFKDIKVLNGFQAGLRYNYDLGAFEMTYNRRFTRRIGDYFENVKAVGMGNTENSDADFFYEIRAYSFVSEFGGALRLGFSLDYNTYLTEMRYEEPTIRDVKIKQRPLGSRFFIGTYVKNRPNLSFSFRLFYQTLWSDISTAPIRDALNLPEELCTDCSFRPSTFGISIMINNGAQ